MLCLEVPNTMNKNGCFFEGRHTHNSEYNIELGDGGNMTCTVWNFIGWLFFLKNPDSEKHRTAFTPLFASQLPVLFVRADIDWHYAFPGALKDWKQKNSPRLRKTQNSIHPFVCFSASCPFCPRGHWLTLCISRCIKTYGTHRIESEVIADLRFSAPKISRLPPKILVPATLVPLPQFRDVICVALPMQRTCNTHATHMQHEPFPWKFPGKVPAGMKIYIFYSKTGAGLKMSNPARWL